MRPRDAALDRPGRTLRIGIDPETADQLDAGSEVLGKDRVDVEGGGEAGKLISHVRAGEATEIRLERLGSGVELLIEGVDRFLAEDALAATFAIGTAQHDPPRAGAGFLPGDGIHELGPAVEADMEVSVLLDGGSGAEKDDLDRLAARQLNASDVVGFLVFVTVHDRPYREVSAVPGDP